MKEKLKDYDGQPASRVGSQVGFQKENEKRKAGK